MSHNTIQLFNSSFENLINYIMTIPELKYNKDIIVGKEAYNILRSMNVSKPLELAVQYIWTIFRNEIIEHNEKYFIEMTEEKIRKLIKDNMTIEVDYTAVFEQIHFFRTLWTTQLKEDVKTKLWKYCELLMKLCDRYADELKDRV